MPSLTDLLKVGGSLGGLFAGIVFKRLGHHVRILERTPSALLHNQGAGIVAGGPTQEFFSQYDRTETPIAVSSHTRRYLDQAGAIIDSADSEQKMTSWDLLYNVLRANFDGEGDPKYCTAAKPESGDGQAEYLYGHKVTGLKDVRAAGVELAYEKDSTTGTLTADLLIAADGPSSTIRSLLDPATKRTYAGYVAWRGTIPETAVSPDTLECFKEKFIFFHRPGVQILAYLIPGPNGTLKSGERLINYVWYCNYQDGSEEMADLMTDQEGQKHHFTLPAGKMRGEVWERQKDYAEDILPPQFSELVRKTETPFIQAVTDVVPGERQVLMDGKVLLVGDAIVGLRPHTAASTSQAARDALLLHEVFGGKMELGEWEAEVKDWAVDMQKSGVKMGDRSQFGHHPLDGQR